MRNTDILIVDDEVGIRELLSEILQDEGYSVCLAENAAVARTLRNQETPALVLLDIWMPECDGVTLLKEWGRNGQLTMPVIMMSGHATIDTAVEATRIGAFDFLEKPISLQKLLGTIKRALSQAQTKPRPTPGLMALGQGRIIQALAQQLDTLKQTPYSEVVLLSGEPGSGHEHCARHFVEAQQPWAVLSSEALADVHISLLQKNTGGVLYLPELGLCSTRAQQGLAFLLPRLEKYTCRLVISTTHPLESFFEPQRFDAALFSQLSRHTVAIPPLRAHLDDLPFLAAQLLETGAKTLAPDVLMLLERYEWPGNLEQLANILHSASALNPKAPLKMEDVHSILQQFKGAAIPLPSTVQMNAGEFDFNLPLREVREQFERKYFEYQMAQTQGNMSRVAARSGLERTHLYRKLKQLGIRLPRAEAS